MHHPKRIHGSREIFEKPVRAKPSITSGWNSIRIQIPPAAVLLLEQEGLYESCERNIVGAKTRQGSEPPAGPPKLSKSLGESTFPKISVFFPATSSVAFIKNWNSKQLVQHVALVQIDAAWSEIIDF